jgi:hypothetical protein
MPPTANAKQIRHVVKSETCRLGNIDYGTYIHTYIHTYIQTDRRPVLNSTPIRSRCYKTSSLSLYQCGGAGVEQGTVGWTCWAGKFFSIGSQPHPLLKQRHLNGASPAIACQGIKSILCTGGDRTHLGVKFDPRPLGAISKSRQRK